MDNKGFEDQDKVPETKTKQQLAEELKGMNNNNISDDVIKTDPDIKKQNKREERQIMKNIVVISFAFMLLFTAFQSMASLQSSINKVSNNIRHGKHTFWF